TSAQVVDASFRYQRSVATGCRGFRQYGRQHSSNTGLKHWTGAPATIGAPFSFQYKHAFNIAVWALRAGSRSLFGHGNPECDCRFFFRWYGRAVHRASGGTRPSHGRGWRRHVGYWWGIHPPWGGPSAFAARVGSCSACNRSPAWPECAIIG